MLKVDGIRTIAIVVIIGLLGLFAAEQSWRSESAAALPSWRDGPAKTAILEFVRVTTDQSNPNFVPPKERIATFDQDGTLWVEHPLYTQIVFFVDQIRSMVAEKPELKDREPYKTIVTGDWEAISRLPHQELEKVLLASVSNMPVEQFNDEVRHWLLMAKHPRYQRPYTELAYQPMLELLDYLRANGYKTYIVTGSGQEFVRVYAEQVYGIPPEQIVGTAGETKFTYDPQGRPQLMKEPKLLLDDDFAGKPEGIYLMIGLRPFATFGNSTGDRQMLEYTQAGDRKRLMMLVLHDDAEREYAYGPAQGLPTSDVGTFTQELYDQAIKQGWFVISMKNDWNRIFPFESTR